MKNRLIALGCVSGALLIAAPPSQGGDPPRTRRAFVEAINKVKVGMSERAVTALLGKPDDIRTQEDSGGIPRDGTREIWRYGTSGHLTTATLGQIWMHDVHRVQVIFGQGSPPPESIFTEPELRLLLDALGQVPSFNAGRQYNPRFLIRAVNLLQPLGKEKASAVIEEFLRIAPDSMRDEGRDGVFLVLRTLFEAPAVPTQPPNGGTLPAGCMPRISGMPSPDLEPADNRILPRYPIAIEGDIPFLLVTQYWGFGARLGPEAYLPYFRKYGTIRAKPLVPTSKPFAAIEALAKSPRWIFDDKKSSTYGDAFGRRMLGNQVLRLLDTVYRVEPDIYGNLLPSCESEEQRKRLAEASKLSIRWEAGNGRYTFLDGTFLQPRDLKPYRRHLWQTTVPLLKVELIVERESRRYASVEVKLTREAGLSHPIGIMRVFRIKTPGKPLLEFHVVREWNGISTVIQLDEGDEIQAELTIGKDSQRSPVFKP